MADTKRINEIEAGEDVTVITRGQYQLVDVAAGIKIPPLREVTLPKSPFVEMQLLNGNLLLADEQGAPKAEGDALKAEDLTYDRSDMPASEGQVAERASRDGKEPVTDANPAADDQNSSTGNEALTSTSASKSSRRQRSSDTEE
jgi:hypothetical protein